MPGFFGNFYKRITIQSHPSSEIHNNTQATNSIIQILTTSVESYAPAVVIPGTMAQVLASIYTIFHNDAYASEKLLHLLQGAIAAARFGLAVTLLFEKQQCDASSQTNICIASFLLLLLYSATISVGLAISALSKGLAARQVRVAHSDDEEHGSSTHSNCSIASVIKPFFCSRPSIKLMEEKGKFDLSYEKQLLNQS